MSLFCRHNRFTADCPICAKGTVLEGRRTPARRPASGGTRRPKAQEAAPGAFSGRYVTAGPYDAGEGSYEVRLERVPGGIRLAEWDGSGLRRRAPVLAAADVPRLIEGAGAVLDGHDAARLAGALRAGPGDAAPDSPAEHGSGGDEGAALGVSRGRSGDFQEELRVEPVGAGRVRIARWMLRPGSGWRLQEAPPMLPATRYAEALAGAARHGLVPSASDAGGGSRL